jgi:DNA-binding CsgD family transcriptional regulator
MVARPDLTTNGRLAAARDAFDRGRPSLTIALLRGGDSEHADDPEERLLLARALTTVERDAEAGAVLRGLDADPRLAPGDRAVALALAAHVTAVGHDPERGRVMAREALAASTGTDSAAAIAQLTIGRATMFDGDLPGATRMVRRAARTAIDATPDERATLAMQEAFLLLQQDRFEAAERTARHAVAGVPPPTPRLRAMLRHALGAARFHSGAWDGIEALLDPRTDIDAGLDIGDDRIAGMAGLLSIVLVHRDRLADAGELLGRSFPALVTGQRPFLLWGAMLLAEALGDERATRDSTDRLIASFGLLGSPGGLRIYGSDLVRVLVDLGEQGRAAALTSVVEGRVAPSGTPSVASTAALLRGLVDRDPVRLQRAAEGFRAAGRPLEEAMAREQLGRAIAGHDRSGAVAALRQALAGYGRLGASRDERRLEARLRELGACTGRRGRRTRATVGWDALSPSEQAIARLVAAGLTNREIGDRRSISARTVETHIAHAMAKLVVRNRAELAALVARAGGDVAPG